MVVLVVGADVMVQASGARGSASTMSAARARVESGLPVIAIRVRPKRRAWPITSASSAVSPEYDKASTASPGWIMPRSPCEASAGWTNSEGVPVEASVAWILRPT